MPRRFAQLSLLLLAGAAGLLSWTLTVDYFDSYDTLSNARLLVGNGYGDYVRHRGVLAGPLFAGLAGLERLWPGFPFFRTAHLLCALLTSLLVVSFYFVAKRISPRHAWAGALALALNPLVVHYGVFAKEDMPAALFTLLGFSEVLRAGVGSAPLWFAAASLMRPNLFPAIFCTLFVFRWAGSQRHGAIRRYGGWALATITAAWGVYAWAGLGGPGAFIHDLLGQWKDNHQACRPPTVGLALVGAALPLAVIAAAAVGAVRKGTETTRLAAIWAAVFVCVQVFVVSGKEARYFLPAIPALYLLAVAGFERLPKAFALVWWLALPAGLLELARFQDPGFSRAPGRAHFRTAAALSRTGSVIWVGTFYPLRPRSIAARSGRLLLDLSPMAQRSRVSSEARSARDRVSRDRASAERRCRRASRIISKPATPSCGIASRAPTQRDLPGTLSPIVIARVELHDRSQVPPGPGPFEEYAGSAEGLRSLGWRQATDVPQTLWWLQLQGVSEQPLNKSEHTPYTL